MHLALLVAASITLVAAVGVFLWLPARAPAPDIPAPLAGRPGGERRDESPVPASTS